MIIELHAIHSFAPSNLNRDDTGNPKEALFGGVRRARISSQSAKRAMRVSDIFKNAVAVKTGTRTKRLVMHVSDMLAAEGIDAAWTEEHAAEIAKDLYAKLDSKSKTAETSVLLYISDDEVADIVRLLRDAHQAGETPDIKDFGKRFIKNFTNRTSAPDIALFGRMLAENPKLNIDAACQVAHAISTHEVNTAEFDYFTAVDDWKADLQMEDATGAAMIGLVAFNSATYYRCARIDWKQLMDNLNGDVELAKQTVGAFMRAFALVVPSGMQNSFVNKHLPDFLLAAARPNNDGQSLANAFERPVRAEREGGFAAPSVKKMAKYWEQVESCFRLSAPTVAVLNPRGYELDSDELSQATVASLSDWAAAMTNALDET